MKSDTCLENMRKRGNPYTKYEGGGRRPAPSYDDSIRATGRPVAASICSESRPHKVVKKIEFRTLPLPGTVLLHEGQRYVVTGSDLRRRKDGEIVPIIFWQSHCAECGALFECWSGMRSGTLNRRCRLHHAPGKAVTAAGKKNSASHLRKYGPRQKR